MKKLAGAGISGGHYGGANASPALAQPENEKAHYLLNCGLSFINQPLRWLLDLGSNQGPTD